MRIMLFCHLYGGMAKLLSNDSHGNATLGQQRAMGVAQCMKACRWDNPRIGAGSFHWLCVLGDPPWVAVRPHKQCVAWRPTGAPLRKERGSLVGQDNATRLTGLADVDGYGFAVRVIVRNRHP